MNYFDILLARKLKGGGGGSSYELKTASGDIISIPNGVALPMPSLTVGIEAQQSGTGDPSPTNIRPITGWSAVNVVDTGVNVWDKEWEVGAISNINGENYTLAERIRSKNYISVKANTPYYLYLPNTYSSPRIACYDKDKEYLGQATGWLPVNNNTAFTTPSNTYYIRFVVVKADETYNNDISINYPSTDTSYHAYNGTTYTTTLKDGQGNPLTCYGGELSNENGVQTLTVTHGYIASYNGETLPSTWISDRDVYAEGTTPTTGAEVVYTLATPQQFPQDNLAIATQDGTNNIWADSGTINECKYFVRV